MKRLLVLALATLIGAAASISAQELSPIGVWKTIDDSSGKVKSLVRITEASGEYKGKIEKLFRDPSEDQNPKCTKCEGERYQQQILGMIIMSGTKRDGDEYSGGQILDPDNGKTYSVKLTVIEGGKKLNVRGYIGVPWIGRSQTWIREE
ncbi:MAG: DUF2147 domain-containing protein [Burkholderiales bacterium]